MREVLVDLDGLPSALGTGKLGRGIERVLVQLHSQHAARHKRGGRDVEQASIEVEPVRAAGKRERRLEVGNLGRESPHDVIGNVGRVGHEHGEGAHELGGDAGGEVALDDVDGIGKTQGVAVLAREGHGRGTDVRRRNARAGSLARDRARDAAGAAADLEHSDLGQPLGGIDTLKGRVHQKLGLRTRDEHARAARHVHEAKRGLTRDVLQWLAGGAALHEAAHTRELVLRERLVVGHVEARAVLARRGREQPLRREARVVVALALQVAAGPVEAALDGPGLLCGHGPSKVRVGRHIGMRRRASHRQRSGPLW